ncbi:MAG: sigma factor-like helix-turn-helix DNA-binding protein [Candidatus Paceibacterota bacterium]|jgi:hypothetical protein|nr:sigma factor-like helix-turn-helix DNA-binding protein [Candidatus Paceibacterota bacterium]MDD3548588.1 sigma factor-like helix-turn-helix DNA-binding protein [Candidatus Paceibacterota bacterium]MDD4999029.1 sigma factor-like helix-turn-helix DNA-binding protein [Candidatus Paceibacterota bacterium]MDD5545194.1 sigma factor-like helix-turn-helix DNA-binding protein [Candidatus Paceibacterota bacterium]
MIKNISQKNFKNNPQFLALEAISNLNPRSQDILKKRYGLVDDKPKTLEAVGKDYKVTRERIRQIIEAALKSIDKTAVLEAGAGFFDISEKILKENGGAEEEEEFLKRINLIFNGENKNYSSIKFLLFLNQKFILEEETADNYSFWRLSEFSKDKILKNIKTIEKYLSQKKTPLIFNDLFSWSKINISKNIKQEELRAYLRISNKIRMNPFGEFGLFNWNEIDPSGAKDRAYLLMKHQNKPLHFSEIALMLNENKLNSSQCVLARSWQKKVCTQTVHNELIKDPRFVLIGRGIYALKEWGYEPGKIIDVIIDILKKAGEPLSQEEIIRETKKRRIAKDNTIILNLHNKKYFKKLPNKSYTLVKSYKIFEV